MRSRGEPSRKGEDRTGAASGAPGKQAGLEPEAVDGSNDVGGGDPVRVVPDHGLGPLQAHLYVTDPGKPRHGGFDRSGSGGTDHALDRDPDL